VPGAALAPSENLRKKFVGSPCGAGFLSCPRFTSDRSARHSHGPIVSMPMPSTPLDLTESPDADGSPSRVNVSEETIARIVDRFYGRIRTDERLGPLFASRITDWDRHLGIMRDFWSAALSRTGRYAGRPVERHRMIDGLTAEDFERWLGLFRTAVREHTTADEAAAFIEIAERMAEAMGKMLGLRPRADGIVRAAPFVAPPLLR